MPNMRYQLSITKPGKHLAPRDEDWFNIPAGDVLDFDLRYGSLQPNNLGYVAAPGEMTVGLNNGEDAELGEGWLYPIPGRVPDLDTRSGAQARLWSREATSNQWSHLWQGWTGPMQMQEIEGKTALAILPVHGALEQLGRRFSELFLTLPGNETTGRVMARVLRNVGWPFGVDLNDGNTVISAWLANFENVFRGGQVEGENPAGVMDALAVLAGAEGGIVYDSHVGAIAFRDRRTLARAASSAPTWTLRRDQLLDLAVPNIEEGIVNEIVGSGSKFIVSPTNVIPWQTGELPATLEVPPATSVNAEAVTGLYSDPSSVAGQASTVLRIDRANQTNRITEMTLVDPTPQQLAERGISVRLTPTTAGDALVQLFNSRVIPATVTIRQINGTVWRDDEPRTDRIVRRYNEESRRRYGLQSYTYPASIVPDDALGQGGR